MNPVDIITKGRRAKPVVRALSAQEVAHYFAHAGSLGGASSTPVFRNPAFQKPACGKCENYAYHPGQSPIVTRGIRHHPACQSIGRVGSALIGYVGIVDADEMASYMDAIYKNVKGLNAIIEDNLPEDKQFKSSWLTFATLFLEWYIPVRSSWYERKRDINAQKAVSFHMRFIDWRKAAKDRGYPTDQLGPDQDPKKAEEDLKKGQTTPEAPKPQTPGLDVPTLKTGALLLVGGALVGGVVVVSQWRKVEAVNRKGRR